MTEILFYHLDKRPLEAVLPALLERSLERGWRVVVQAGSPERVASLDAHLWTYRDDSFLPHGSDRATAADETVFLTTADENPNRAAVRFVVDGAKPGTLDGLERVVVLFDGSDEAALADARAAWSAARAAGHDVTYWRENEAGRFEKKA